MRRRPCAAPSQKALVSGLGCGAGILRSAVAMTLLPLQDDGGAAVPCAERPAGAMREREVTVLHLHLGMGLAAKLPHRLDHLGHAAAIGGVIVAEAAAVGVEGQLPRAGDEVAVGDEASAAAARRETQVLEA